MSFWPLETSLTDEIRGRAPAIELGGGDGAFARILTRVGVRPMLLDIDPSMLRAAHPRVPAVVGEAARLPLRSGQVQLLSCANLLRSLTDQLDRLARECHRALSRGGCLLILEDDPIASTPAEQNYRDTLALLASVDPRRGKAIGSEAVAAPFRAAFGEPSLRGVHRNELSVAEPMRPLDWLAARRLNTERAERVRRLSVNVRRNGMSYGNYWFELYSRGHHDTDIVQSS